MPIAAGTHVYDCTHSTVLARGLSMAPAELTDALTNRLPSLVHDEEGSEELRDLFDGLATTQFETDHLERVLNVPRAAVEPWRVGEALAEAYLVDHRGCEFPWPSGRDLKNPEASPAGADLAGFIREGDDDLLALGEVKTSFDTDTPPSVMTGRHGMVAQLEALRDATDKVYGIVRYLGFRAQASSWKDKLKVAWVNFSRQNRFYAFGVLIRDTPPAPLDLQNRCRTLADGCPATVSIELRALYLPSGSIPTLPTNLGPRRRISP